VAFQSRSEFAIIEGLVRDKATAQGIWIGLTRRLPFRRRPGQST